MRDQNAFGSDAAPFMGGRSRVLPELKISITISFRATGLADGASQKEQPVPASPPAPVPFSLAAAGQDGPVFPKEEQEKQPAQAALSSPSPGPQGSGLVVSQDVVDVILQLASGQACNKPLSSEAELNALRIFMTQVSHRRASPGALRLIAQMTLRNQREVLQATLRALHRHRKTENNRTVLTLLNKFCRNHRCLIQPRELDAASRVRFSEQKIIVLCLEDPDFHARLLRELDGVAFNAYCLETLRAQLTKHLHTWAVHFQATGEWKARFVSFPTEVQQAKLFFLKAVKS